VIGIQTSIRMKDGKRDSEALLTVSTVHGDRFDGASSIVKGTLSDSSRCDRRASRVGDEPIVKGIVLALDVGRRVSDTFSKRMTRVSSLTYTVLPIGGGGSSTVGKVDGGVVVFRGDPGGVIFASYRDALE